MMKLFALAVLACASLAQAAGEVSLTAPAANSVLTVGKPVQFTVTSTGGATNVNLEAVGDDLNTFTHVNAPAAAAGTKLSVTFPKGGSYIVGAEAMGVVDSQVYNVTGTPALVPYNDTRLDVPEAFVVPLPLNGTVVGVDLASLLRPERQAKYHVTIDGPTGAKDCVPGQAANYTIYVMIANPMSSVLDLKQYLGQDAHVTVVGKDLTSYQHVYAVRQAAGAGAMDMSGMDMSNMPINSLVAAGGNSGRRLLQQATTDMSMAGMDHSSMDHSSMDHSSMDHSSMDHSMMDMAANPAASGSGSAATFGPKVVAEIAFPAAGEYAIIAQLARQQDLIVAPFYLTCGDLSSAALSQAATEAGAESAASASPAPSSSQGMSAPAALLLTAGIIASMLL